jgi:hypothetical protein
MKFRNDPIVRLYDKTQDWLQERGQPVVRVLGIVAVLVVVVVAVYYFFSYRQSRAADDYAEAWRKYNAQVVDTPVATGSLQYTDEKVKWQEAAQAFESVAQKQSGYYGSMARYLAGTAYLRFDREKGQRLLQESAAENEQPAADLARLALAENHLSNGETEQAIPILEALSSSQTVPKQVVQLQLGLAYQKSGDAQKAADMFFQVASVNRSTSAGSEAEKRLSAVAPDRIKDLPPPNTPDLPE